MGISKLYRQGRCILQLLCLCFAVLLTTSPLAAQNFLQTVKGTIRDQESRQPIAEVILKLTNQKTEYTTFTDNDGNFRIKIPSGRWDIGITHLGYGPKIQNIQVGTGKEVMLEIYLEAKVFETSEVEVSAVKKSFLTPASGASVRTLQSQDAARFAGGY